MTLNADQTVAVDRNNNWRPIDADTPRGVKVQVINRKDNVAQYSIVLTNNVHWTHWAPVPTFADDPV